jgi:hypothetical protein
MEATCWEVASNQIGLATEGSARPGDGVSRVEARRPARCSYPSAAGDAFNDWGTTSRVGIAV